MIGVTSFGSYIPRLRLSRKAIAESNGWMEPSLLSLGKGERSMCNWDEDAVTMAVDAARDCLAGVDRSSVEGLYLASTSLPFLDRQNAGIVATALNLPENLSTLDITSSQKAGTSGLLAALRGTGGGATGCTLFIASDKRRTKSAGSQEMLFGDGAAALLVGTRDVVAEFKGGHSVSVDFVDHYRGRDGAFDYAWEERWVREEGFLKIVPRAVAAALERTGVRAGEVDHFVMPCTSPGVTAGVAAKVGIRPETVRDTLHLACGETGTAHPIVMFVDALQDAGPGEKILVVGFGQGCDALLFETTPALMKLPKRRGTKGSLSRRKEERNYMKYLSFNRLVVQERGIRAENNPQTALTALYRNRRMLLGLVGGYCEACDTPQFPKSEVCVNPACHAVSSQRDHEFSDEPGSILSWSADALVYSADPPAHYGMVQFQRGGRFMADFTDCDVGGVAVGMPVRMVFRIRGVDEARGMVRYFWKAAPVKGPNEEA